mgnify:CR=1 FL=1
MLLQSSPYVIPLSLASLVALALAILSWRRRQTPGALYFFVLMIGLTIWSFAAILELVVVDLPTKILFGKVTYIGIVTVMASWTAFVLQQTGHERWLTRRNFIFLLLDPIFALLFVWTNELHGLIWSNVRLIESGGLIVGDYGHGIVFWIHAAYGYGVLLFTSFLLARRLLRTENLYRRQAAVMLVSIFAPWVGNFLYLVGWSVVDLTPFGFTITAFFWAWGLLSFRLLDIVPIARETVIENMLTALLVLDAQNRLLDLNLAASTIIGKKSELLVGSTLAQVLPEVVGMVEPTAGGTQEIMLMQHDTPRYFEVQIFPLVDITKRLRGRTVLLHDVTLRKRAAQRIESQNTALEAANQALELARLQAEEATRLKSQFLATMSHELRTPLTAIIGYTEIQLAGMAGELSAEQRSFQDRVLVNADHLLKLINEILDLAKIEAGKTEVAKKPFEVHQWLKEVVSQIEGLAQQKGLTFEYTLDERLPAKLLGDAPRLKQIMINLLSNAIKFTERGYIKCDVLRQDDHTWMIVIQDTGIGIPTHLQEIIFEEFRQVDSSSTRNYGGTGLGLAIVRKLVLSMGGDVRLNSQSGLGSTFTVTLPLMSAPQESELAAVIV